MGALKRIFSNWWVVTGLAVLVLLLLFCFGLPLFVSFFRALWVRISIAILLVGAWGVLAYLRRRKALKASAAIADALAASSDGEDRVLAERMNSALAQLKSSGNGRRDYLYAKPWYVVIGPPAAGKTTALRYSGLRFPFGDTAAKGVGGTRNLDFWFADKAVFIDTAGRYTSQDSDAAADAKGWKAFLGLLKKSRPLQPINGVVVAIGVDELITKDRVAIDTHAAAVRRRMAELRSGLEAAVPVYVLLTKSDLIAGFTEFFADLDVEARRAVLGHTFPFAKGKPDTRSLTAAFDEVAQAISDRQAKRLADESDLQWRSLILGFPAQFAAIRARLIRFIEGAFIVGEEPAGTLRGFYFASGLQEGTPFDRVISSMAEVYDQPAAEGGASSRAYFINRLLGDVMFPEAGLVRMDSSARTRHRSRQVLALGGIAAVVIGMTLLWTVSFFGNRALQSTLQVQATAVQRSIKDRGIDLVTVSRNGADLEDALPVLNSLRALAQGYQDIADGGPPLTMRFGLFQSSLSAGADEAYRDGLRRILLPRLMLRLEAALREAGNDEIALYEPLRIYLMLGGHRPGGVDAGAVQRWVTSDWEAVSLAGPERSSLRKRLATHLDALLKDPQIDSAWANRSAPLDSTLVTTARGLVQAMKPEDLAYAFLRQKVMSVGGRDWLARSVIGETDVPAFANGRQVLEARIPFFFTSAGFEAYQLGKQNLQNDLAGDYWVLSDTMTANDMRARVEGTEPGIAIHYADEYTAQWKGLVSMLKPAAYFQDKIAYGTFTKAPAPFKQLLLAVRANTRFEGGTTAARAMIAEKAAQKAGKAAKLLPASSTMDAGTRISDSFRELHLYVGDGKSPAQVDAFIDLVRTAGRAVFSAENASGAASDALQVDVARASTDVGLLSAATPELLRTFVDSTASGGSIARDNAQRGAVSENYTSDVYPACKATTEDRYPFLAEAQADARTPEMLQLFGLNGTMDNFIRTRATPLLETSGPVWRWNPSDPVASGFNQMSAGQLAKASKIRDLLVSGVMFKVSLESLGSGIDSAEFLGNRFDGRSKAQRAYQWSLQGMPEARVVLYKGDQLLDEFAFQGTWAIFRLMDSARKKNDEETSFFATFGSGDQTATFRIALTTTDNPFNRSMWMFRCPAQL